MMFASSVPQLVLSQDDLWLAALLMAVLFALSFFFSGTETSLFGLQKVERQRLRRGTEREQRAAALLDRRSELITTLLIGNETVNIALSAISAAVVASLFPGKPLLNVVLLTPALLLFSEITPKVLAFRFGPAWARVASGPLRIFAAVVWPARVLVSAIVRLLARLFRVSDLPEDERLQEDEILNLLEQSTLAGDVATRELDIVEAVFEFDEISISRVMTPRPDVFSLPLELPWTELVKRCRETRFSRVPIYGERPDDVLGVLLVKDLLRYRHAPLEGPRQLRSLLLPPVFVPPSKPADTMLREFLEKKAHMAFVVDEHGTLVGLVTLDDLLAELLDHETDHSGPDIKRLNRDTVSVKAWMDIEDFQEETGIELPEGDYDTVGGYVFHALGRLPALGDQVQVEERTFVVGAMDGRRIATVHIVRKPVVSEVAQ